MRRTFVVVSLAAAGAVAGAGADMAATTVIVAGSIPAMCWPGC